MYSLLRSQDRSHADECMMSGDVQPVGLCWSWVGCGDPQPLRAAQWAVPVETARLCWQSRSVSL